MKKISNSHKLVLAGIALMSLAFSPVIRAQTMPADSTQSTKTTDSTADQNSSTTGTATTPNNTNSKDATNTLDANPSLAPTDSAQKSATKDPNSTSPDQSATTSTPKAAKPFSDSAFILKAAQGGMTEVALGKLAQDNGSSADVKQFGSHMVMDHSAANDKLKAIATKDGVTVPSDLDAKHQAMVDKMSKLSGPAFDKAYVQAMVTAHEKDASDFRKASKAASDPDLKSFAADTLTMVKSHLADIKSIQSKM